MGLINTYIGYRDLTVGQSTLFGLILCWVFIILSFFIMKLPLKYAEKKTISILGIGWLFFIFASQANDLLENIPKIFNDLERLEYYSFYFYSLYEKSVFELETAASLLVLKVVLTMLLCGWGMVNYWMLIFRNKYFSFKRFKWIVRRTMVQEEGKKHERMD